MAAAMQLHPPSRPPLHLLAEKWIGNWLIMNY